MSSTIAVLMNVVTESPAQSHSSRLSCVRDIGKRQQRAGREQVALVDFQPQHIHADEHQRHVERQRLRPAFDTISRTTAA